MKTVTFETKEQLHRLCKEICSMQYGFYKERIDIIEQHGATAKINYLFCYKGKYSKYPNLDKPTALIVWTCLYPASVSFFHAEKKYMCQNYYSKIGTIKKRGADTYQLKVNDQEDKGMTMFLKKHSKRLISKSAEVAFRHRLSDVFTNLVFPKRPGSSFNKTFRGFPVKMIVVIVLLILLFLIRLATPTGYHPSLK